MRAPALIYRWRLGWLLDERFLLLTHVGRRSGRRYRTPLEVVGRGSDPFEVVVLAGLGDDADWVRNIRSRPAVEVHVGRRRFAPVHRELDELEAEAVLADYERRHRRIAPVVRAVLSRLVGWRYDGTPDARKRLVRELPLIAFSPVHRDARRGP